MNHKFYNNQDGGVFDTTRLKLALFDENTVRDIIALVNYRGAGLVDDIFRASTEADPPHILGVLGPDYMKYNDVPGVLLGLATLIMADIRKPKRGPDEYADILAGAFGLPTLLARRYADKIESYDAIVADANQDQQTAFTERLQQYVNVLEEGARRVVNGLANTLGLSTILNWDQSQDYDVDFLDELHELGEVVAKLNRRSRLMSGQALITAQMQVFQTGDIDDDGFGDPMAEMVGDILSAAGSRNLPPSLTGNFKDTMLKARLASLNMGKELFNHAGVEVSPSKQIKSAPTSSGGKKLKKIIASVFKKNPLVATLIGASKAFTGSTKGLAKAASKNSSATGDIASLYGDISREFGHDVADAWIGGDIDTIGDLIEDVNGQMIGDHDEDVETGGLFNKKKNRRAAAKQKAAKAPANIAAKNVALRAQYARQAAAQRSKIIAANREAALSNQYVDPNEYFGTIDPSEGLGNEEFDNSGLPSADSMLDTGMLDSEMLSTVPDLDAGSVFDASMTQ